MVETMSHQDEPTRRTPPASPGLWRTAGIAALAGVICGAGALLGVAIGSNDGIPNSKVLFAVLGMLAISIAPVFLLPKNWRKQWAASLPFFWVVLGGSLIAEFYFGVDSAVAVPIALVLGIPVGQVLGGLFAKQMGFDHQPSV